MTAFFESTASLIAAMGALLAGLAAVISAAGKSRPAYERPGENQMSHPLRSLRSIKATASMGIFLVLLSLSLFSGRALSSGEHALNVELTTAMFEAFNRNDFGSAMANADKCVAEFREAADREQAELEKAKEPAPAKDKFSEEEKKIILSRGLLNDVAACLYIKGRSAENLGRREEAKKAYEAARKYTYARVWDPQGWFWSPAEAAEDRLAKLK